MAVPTVLFRSWPEQEGATYDTCCGIYQAENGDLLFFGKVKAENADDMFDRMSKLPGSTALDVATFVELLKEVGVPDIVIGQRFRRKGKKLNKALPELVSTESTPTIEKDD